MSNRIIILLVVLVLPTWLHAQASTNKDDKWVINEIYTSDSPTRYGLFVELYNPADPKVPSNLYISTDKGYPNQFRVRSRSHFNPDWRKKGYRSVKVSALRFRARTIKMQGNADTLYLFKREGYEFALKDSFPVLWNDSLSLGRCGNRICYFNIPTPGRPNKNVSPMQYMPRKNYRISILGGTSSANNTGASLLAKIISDGGSGESNDQVGGIPSFGIKGQKVVNRRLYYTTTSAAIFHQGYSMKSLETLTTSTGLLTRKVDGYYSGFEFWVGKDIGIFLTPRFDLSAGAGLVLATFGRQVYSDKRTFVRNSDGSVLEDDLRNSELISNYQLPVLTFNTGLNYQLTPHYKIELLYNILFRTFQKNETIYYYSFNIGLSYSFKHKGRGYREALLW